MKYPLNPMSFFTKIFCLALLLGLVQFFEPNRTAAQTKRKAPIKKRTPPKLPANLPTVTQIDEAALAELIKRKGTDSKPLLVNFWATWCDPCREEFPDLVKIDEEFRGKMDSITISLDELADLKTEVPKFLASMKATMPAYLLKAADEEAAIVSVSKDWQGGLPFTILLDTGGTIAYAKQGKFKPDVLRSEINKLLSAPVSETSSSQPIIRDLPLVKPNLADAYERGKADAGRDFARGKFVVRRIGFAPGLAPEYLKDLRRRHGIEIIEHGWLATDDFSKYAAGYNEVMTAQIMKILDRKTVSRLGL